MPSLRRETEGRIISIKEPMAQRGKCSEGQGVKAKWEDKVSVVREIRSWRSKRKAQFEASLTSDVICDALSCDSAAKQPTASKQSTS